MLRKSANLAFFTTKEVKVQRHSYSIHERRFRVFATETHSFGNMSTLQRSFKGTALLQ